MDIKEYISSGILELYAMDMLTVEEREDVYLMLQKYPEVSAELNKIELTIESYATQFKQSPPSAGMKERILSSIPFEETPVVPIKNDSSTFLKMFAVAASLLFLVSLGFNFYQIRELEKTENELQGLIAEKTFLAEEKSQIKAKYEEEKNKVNLFQNPEIQNVLIKGSDLSPDSYAFVSFNKNTKSISISGINLPENNKEHQYQLWALVDGNPVDLGVFDSSDSLLHLTKTVDKPDAFAVTLQDRGGNETPNLEKLYLIGNV